MHHLCVLLVHAPACLFRDCHRTSSHQRRCASARRSEVWVRSRAWRPRFGGGSVNRRVQVVNDERAILTRRDNQAPNQRTPPAPNATDLRHKPMERAPHRT